MQVARTLHTATPLNDGTVLVAGGLDGNQNPCATSELYSYLTQTWASVGSLKMPRYQQAAALLADGQSVVVVGGSTYYARENPSGEC
jgi:hypothetical protein